LGLNLLLSISRSMVSGMEERITQEIENCYGAFQCAWFEHLRALVFSRLFARKACSAKIVVVQLCR
jgi:hypothetical protein